MKRVGSIAIVGGGSAGWMAAAYLSKVLVDVKVTLIESAKIHNFLSELGFTSPDQWMPECDATYKTGIWFENWFEKGDSYWHPFELLDYVEDNTHIGHCWLAKHAVDGGGFRDRGSFCEQYFPSMTLNVGH